MLAQGRCSILRTGEPIPGHTTCRPPVTGLVGRAGTRGLWALFEQGRLEVVKAGNVRKQWRQQVLEEAIGQRDF